MKKLDLETKLFLFITGATIEKEKKYTEGISKKNSVYIFENYNEFKSYFKKYLNEEVDESLINLAIYTKSKSGHVIALQGLCDRIITLVMKER